MVFYNHTTDIGFVGIDVDSSSVMARGLQVWYYGL